jgi:hypothetical protein
MEELLDIGWRILVSLLAVGVFVVLWSKAFPDEEPGEHRVCWAGVVLFGTFVFLVGVGASWPVVTYATLAMMFFGSVLVARAFCDLVRSFVKKSG